MRLGRSSWELKIDPKRLQEMIKNNFEEDRTRRGEKKDNKKDKKRSTEVTPIIEFSNFGHFSGFKAPREGQHQKI